ncbi:MAG: hypothetical protein WBR26_18445 [Candidatus Acidiferrum sp.]
MKRLLLLVVCCLPIIPCAMAQEGGGVQVGAFADYFRSNATGTNMFGLGGRVGANILPYTKLEGELSYDFQQGYSEGFTSTSSGGSVAFANSNVRVLHGLFGPKVNLGDGHFHPFVELKGGFVNYMFNSAPAGYSSFSHQLANLRAQNLNAALMPGGGLEATIGPVGLRLDVGDEMYFNNGAHQNLAVMFGPFIRF